MTATAAGALHDQNFTQGKSGRSWGTCHFFSKSLPAKSFAEPAAGSWTGFYLLLSVSGKLKSLHTCTSALCFSGGISELLTSFLLNSLNSKMTGKIKKKEKTKKFKFWTKPSN